MHAHGCSIQPQTLAPAYAHMVGVRTGVPAPGASANLPMKGSQSWPA